MDCPCGKKANHKGRCRGPLDLLTLNKFRESRYLDPAAAERVRVLKKLQEMGYDIHGLSEAQIAAYGEVLK